MRLRQSNIEEPSTNHPTSVLLVFTVSGPRNTISALSTPSGVSNSGAAQASQIWAPPLPLDVSLELLAKRFRNCRESTIRTARG